MRWPAILVLLLTSGAATATADAQRIVYAIVVNDTEAPDEGRIIVETAGGLVQVRNEPASPWRDGAPRETSYLDYDAGQTWQTAVLRDGARCTVRSEVAATTPLTETAETAVILGRVCRKATCVIRSNQIEVWHTEGTAERGTPSLGIIAPAGLVLRIVRNGNYEIVARQVEAASAAPVLPTTWGDLVDLPEYRARVTASWVTTVPVFARETINFGADIPPPPADDPAAALGPVSRHAGGTVILRRVRLPEDLDDATIIAELVQYSAGDAYDRTGSVFLIPAARADDRVTFLDALRDSVQVLPAVAGRDGRTYQGIAATSDYQPPIELMRFITPFGVRHYNEQVQVRGLTWADSTVYRLDVTDLAPALRGDAWLGVFIGNYDQGGHVVSLTLRYHPNRREATPAPDEGRRFALPLFNTCNVLEMAGQEYGRIFAADSLTVTFDVPAGAHDCMLRYVTTGHGGWDAGDEFVPKVNEIFVDGETVARLVPWRSDCGAYRAANPASGNFWNGMSSSDYSRSGWCPGAAVSPQLVPLPDLAPGRHEVRVAIPLGAPEGSSFSAWNVSGVLVGAN